MKEDPPGVFDAGPPTSRIDRAAGSDGVRADRSQGDDEAHDGTHGAHAEGPLTVDSLRAENLALRQVNEALRERVAALRRSNADLEQFAYVASHDLQAPLRNISGFVELLSRRLGDSLDERAGNWMQRVVQCTEQMQALIRDLLAYSRIGGSESTVHVDVDLSRVARQTLSVLAEDVARSRASIRIGELPTVPGDQPQLLQLFQNILGNALTYCGDEVPDVEVTSTVSDDAVVLRFSDHGIGLEARDHLKVFEPFKRLHSREEYPGTGIGLAICKRVVDQHGGRIAIESEPGAGTTFVVELPLREQVHAIE